jgi:hypothetical protein
MTKKQTSRDPGELKLSEDAKKDLLAYIEQLTTIPDKVYEQAKSEGIAIGEKKERDGIVKMLDKEYANRSMSNRPDDISYARGVNLAIFKIKARQEVSERSSDELIKNRK